jgi:hypothetical protein
MSFDGHPAHNLIQQVFFSIILPGGAAEAAGAKVNTPIQ